MKVAIVHSHFRRGGVTRVVENAVAAMAQQGVQSVALSGEAYKGHDLPDHRLIEGLGYNNKFIASEGEALARRLLEAATDAFGSLPDIWHIHNHSLGKNVNFPEALRILAQTGARILLQIHDFAEDGRPANYDHLSTAYPDPTTFSKSVYPSAPQIQYAALNQRDASILSKTGLPAEHLHVLPNSVSVPQLETSENDILLEIDQLIIYPTRAIRRKNVGEMLLLAALAPSGTHFATSLIPENPEWLEIHRGWEALAEELDLPVHFGLGSDYSFPALIQRADALITTSVAEGFGLAFLEPALFDKPLIGRNLPEITTDFRTWGINLENLYTELPIPAEAISEAKLKAKLQAALERNTAAYNRPLPDNGIERALNAARSGDGWDFGRLDEELQADAIRYAVKHSKAFKQAAATITQRPSAEQITADRTAIETHLNLSHYGEQLLGIYKGLLKSPVASPDALEGEAILSAFLSPERLYLLRS